MQLTEQTNIQWKPRRVHWDDIPVGSTFIMPSVHEGVDFQVVKSGIATYQDPEGKVHRMDFVNGRYCMVTALPTEDTLQEQVGSAKTSEAVRTHELLKNRQKVADLLDPDRIV